MEATAARPVLKYTDLPEVLETKEDLYNVIVIASRKFQQTAYANRLADKGMTHMDLANELFIKFLSGGLAPSHRKSVGNPSNLVKMPIGRNRAYATLSRDLMDLIRKRTPEEKAKIRLVTTEGLE